MINFVAHNFCYCPNDSQVHSQFYFIIIITFSLVNSFRLKANIFSWTDSRIIFDRVLDNWCNSLEIIFWCSHKHLITGKILYIFCNIMHINCKYILTHFHAYHILYDFKCNQLLVRFFTLHADLFKSNCLCKAKETNKMVTWMYQNTLTGNKSCSVK